MSYLSGVVMIMGSVLAMIGAALALSPDRSILFIKKFPRNKAAGWILLAVDLIWSASLLLQMDMGWINRWKPAIYLLAPAAFVLIVNFMDQLLAARALGGIFLLLPVPVLDAVQWHPSAFRLVIIMLAYLIVIAGMFLVLSPFRFRKTMQAIACNQQRCRMAGLAGLMLGVFVIGLSLAVFS
jgi:uncharacterized protein YjeT (DUF2065 family)